MVYFGKERVRRVNLEHGSLDIIIMPRFWWFFIQKRKNYNLWNSPKQKRENVGQSFSIAVLSVLRSHVFHVACLLGVVMILSRWVNTGNYKRRKRRVNVLDTHNTKLYTLSGLKIRWVIGQSVRKQVYIAYTLYSLFSRLTKEIQFKFYWIVLSDWRYFLYP